MIKICVIMNCYGSLDSMQYVHKTISKLKQSNDNNTDIKFIFSDSSPENIYQNNDLYLKSIFKTDFFEHLKLDNKGVPYKLNKTIDYSSKYNPDLIMILNDDAILKSSIPYNKVFEYFNKNCRPETDVLLITDNITIIQKRQISRSIENGMIFSPKLFNKIKFREDLIIDQFDILFCDTIYQLGGKIIVFPYILLGVEPIGREKNNGHTFLPPWRMYLLIRNTLSLWREKKFKLINDVLISDFYHSVKAILYSDRSNKLIYCKAIFCGIVDGLKHELGVSKNLNELSNDRFR